MQKLFISGNVGSDATIAKVNDSTEVINFNVACNETWLDKQGQKQQRTTWYGCAYFRNTGKTAIAQYLKKGTNVLVVGVPNLHTYTDKNGAQQSQIKVTVAEVELMGSANGGQQQQPQQQQPQQPQQPVQQPQQHTYQQPTHMNVGGQIAPTQADDDLPF